METSKRTSERPLQLDCSVSAMALWRHGRAAALLVLVGFGSLTCHRQGQAGRDDVDASAESRRVSQASRPLVLSMVAVEGRAGSGFRWPNLRLLGDRMWLTAGSDDAVDSEGPYNAYADGDGPLQPGPRLLGKLKPLGSRRVLVAGRYPNLVAVRQAGRVTVGNESRRERGDVYVRKNGSWVEGQPIDAGDSEETETAFLLDYDDGALLVRSHPWNHQPNGAPECPLAGTRDACTLMTQIRLDGSVHTDLRRAKLPPDFVMWRASASGPTLCLVGTRYDPQAHRASGVYVFRGALETGLTPFTLDDDMVINGPSWATCAELGEDAVVSPPRDAFFDPDSRGPDPTVLTWFHSGKVQSLKFDVGTHSDTASPIRAWLILGALVVLRESPAGEPTLYYVRDGSNPQPIELASVAQSPADNSPVPPGTPGSLMCAARNVIVRPPDDVWCQAECHDPTKPDEPSVYAVFRNRPQPQIIRWD